MILTALIVIPGLGGVLAWMLERWPRACRLVAFAACALQLGTAAVAWRGSGGSIEQQAPWIPALGISYHLAMDGISLLLILLTGLLGMVSVACSYQGITRWVGAYHFCVMAVVAGVTGVFLARDLVLFYGFWELMLVPMYFLIGCWGHEHRIHASIKFFIFTFVGSLLMLASILALAFLHARSGAGLTFDPGALRATPLSSTQAMWLMLGFFVGFAIKLPVVPIHTWLADAHTEAPTAGSVLLAGLMLKTGAYGLLRFAIPLFPAASRQFAPVAAMLGMIGILYGAALAFGQRDLKRLIAFSSVSHMGFVLLGLYAGNELSLQGAVLQMVAHGLSTGALFVLAGAIGDRCGTREFTRLGGLWEAAPRLGAATMFFALAALGLPGMVNFVAEFLVLMGAFAVFPVITIVASIGFVLGTVYSLRMVADALHGPNVGRWVIPDLGVREMGTLGVLAALVVWLGFSPGVVFQQAHDSLATVQSALLSTGQPKGG